MSAEPARRVSTGSALAAVESEAPRGSATAAVLTSADSGGRSVVLTFDDGPDPSHTPRLLAVLRHHHVKGVFCLWGEHVEAHPEIVRQIVADGHTLGNHTFRHADMSEWSPEAIRADLLLTNRVIHEAVPGAVIPYFRAPFGAWGAAPEVAAELGMQPLGWRLAAGDWDPPGTDELVRRLRDGITPGAIVLLHDGGGDRSQTVEAVSRVVPELQQKGWRLTLPETRG